MLDNDVITCDGCGARIESRQKSGGWHNPLTAEAHVCEECWDTEIKRTWSLHYDWTKSLRAIKYPLKTFIGRVIEKDDAVQKVMEKYGTVSKTT